MAASGGDGGGQQRELRNLLHPWCWRHTCVSGDFLTGPPILCGTAMWPVTSGESHTSTGRYCIFLWCSNVIKYFVWQIVNVVSSWFDNGVVLYLFVFSIMKWSICWVRNEINFWLQDYVLKSQVRWKLFRFFCFAFSLLYSLYSLPCYDDLMFFFLNAITTICETCSYHLWITFLLVNVCYNDHCFLFVCCTFTHR